MAAFVNMPSLANVYVDTDENGNKWIFFDDFCDLIKNNQSPTDPIKFRRDNMQKELNKHKNGSRLLSSKKQVRVSSALRYILHHYDDFQICRKIYSELENCAIQTSISTRSIFEIYKSVVKSFLKNDIFQEEILSKLTFDETDISTLYTDHKVHFSAKEWKLICFFERHFSKCYDTAESYEEDVKNRIDFLSSLQRAKKCADQTNKICSKFIVEKMKRKCIAEVTSGVTIQGVKCHLPGVIDLHILEAITETNNSEIINCVASVDCSPQLCNHAHGIHIFVEMATEDTSQLEDISILIEGVLRRQHEDLCKGIFYLSPGSLERYKNSEKRIQRFHVRDATTVGRMKDFVLDVWSPTEDVLQPETTETPECASCFRISSLKPIHWQNFKSLEEWILEVPVTCQIFLKAFINSESLRRTSNKTSYVERKVTRLLYTFDSLLNILNNHYIGILQDLNTKELAVNYHDASTVFSIANYSGAASSYKTAERQLKKDSDRDVCYFNTFLRKYPLEYTRLSGTVITEVSLRDCLLVLYMDNLVRLTFHNDPMRGQGRSSQLPMLPLTVKGVPCDAIEVDGWHDDNSCDGSMACACKRTTELTKEDMKHVLLELQNDEKEMKAKFMKLTTWGIFSKWQHVCVGPVKELVHAALINMNKCLTQFENSLNESMHSLSLDDSAHPLQTSTAPKFDERNATGIKFDGFDVDDTGDSSDNSEDDILTDYDEDTRHDEDDDEKKRRLSTSKKYENQEKEDANIELYDLLNDDLTEIEPFGLYRPLQNDRSYMSQNSIEPEESLRNMDKTSEDHLHKPTIICSFGMSQYKPPSMLCRHPPPVVGKDDDKETLRQILDDFLLKAGYTGPDDTLLRPDRVLFGPDNKIGKNLLQLMKTHPKYQAFLPEFPLLHLRKSKIINLGSAYKYAGLIQLLKYMKNDDQESDWARLVTIVNIDAATKVVKRLSQAFHLAFFLTFLENLQTSEIESMVNSFESGTLDDVVELWHEEFEQFLGAGVEKNATFALHVDMMRHCDEVVAIAVAERLGGPSGYALLLASVKSSLPFAFLNGASAYATYCTRLLVEHYKAGKFHRHMKTCLFSTPHKGSSANFALDTQREMDHRDALKSFRPRSTVQSVLPRMSLVDRLEEVSKKRVNLQASGKLTDFEHQDEGFVWSISDTDVDYIVPTASLIIRKGGTSIEPDSVPKNVYSRTTETLPDVVLDSSTWELGKFLIQRFACNEGFFGLKKDDCPNLEGFGGTVVLKNRIKAGKSVTVNRFTKSSSNTRNTEREINELARKKRVQRESKIVNCLSSKMNTCQALLKPDCTKPTVQKSKTMKSALDKLVTSALEKIGDKETKIFSAIQVFPQHIFEKIKIAIVEFAGVKFKTQAETGQQYLAYVEHKVIQHILTMAPNTERMIICEEKYSFTPDNLKAATRDGRRNSSTKAIGHLKAGDEILSESSLDRFAITNTKEGKMSISKYLAENIEKLNIKGDIRIDIDSELHLKNGCEDGSDQVHGYTLPIRAVFSKTKGYVGHEILPLKQCKGEAEMAQVDWLLNALSDLAEGDTLLSVVTSGDIDAVVIHMFALAYLWPRNEKRKFKHDVYVLLQKPKMDLYNVTGILESLETQYDDIYIGIKVALCLCIGGNDFLPKYYGYSHERVLKIIMTNPHFMEKLFKIQKDQAEHLSINVNFDVYKELIKHLYTPRHLDATLLSLDTVRQLTIKLPKQQGHRNPQNWMPPTSALEKMAELLQCQANYFLTAGIADAPLPNSEEKGCFTRVSGCIQYNLGPDCHVSDWKKLLFLPEEDIERLIKEAKVKKQMDKRKRNLTYTPQKGKQLKKQKPYTSTPKKHEVPSFPVTSGD